MRTARDIVATVTFLGTALVFYLVQTAPSETQITSDGVAASSSAVEQCDFSEASLGTEMGIVTEHVHASAKVVTRES